MILSLTLNGIKETESLAKALSRVDLSGVLVRLESDLGGGKTTFVKSYVQAIDSANKLAAQPL